MPAKPKPTKSETFYCIDGSALMRILATLRYYPRAGFKNKEVAERLYPDSGVAKITITYPESWLEQDPADDTN